jgi:hypothetical protein
LSQVKKELKKSWEALLYREVELKNEIKKKDVMGREEFSVLKPKRVDDSYPEKSIRIQIFNLSKSLLVGF